MADNPEQLQVDIRVTPALHPQNVKELDIYDDETVLVLAPTIEVFESAYRGIASVFAAREAASKDPTLNEAAVAIATQDVADRGVRRTGTLDQ